MKKVLSIFVAVLMLALIVACAAPAPTPTTPDGETPPPADTLDRGATDVVGDNIPDEVPEDGPPRGGTFVFSPATVAGVAPVGLPWDINASDLSIIEPFTHGLAAQNLDGSIRLILSQGYEVIVNGDGTYTVIHTLHENIYLHPHSLSDAEKVNAELVVWNAHRFNYYSSWPIGMLDVYVVDEYRVAYVWDRLRNATPSMTAGWITSRMIYETYGPEVLAETPISAGPFRLVEYVRGASVTFERFDNYFMPGRPYLDGMKMVFLGDMLIQSIALESEGEGRVDAVRTMRPEMAGRFAADGFTILNFSNLTAAAILPNDDPTNPLTNPLVRRAVSMAIDREGVTRSLGYGIHIPAYQHVAPGYGGHNTTPGFGAPGFNPEGARELMAEAGFGPDNPLRTTLIKRPGVYTPAQAVAIQSMLSDIWIEAELELPDIGLFTEIRQQTGWDGILLCCFISWMNPEDSGRINFQHIPGVNPNWRSLVPSERMLELIDSALFFGDVIPAVLELTDYVLDYEEFLWVVPLWFQGMYTIIHPRIQGWYPHDHIVFYYRYWMVD